MWPSWYRPHTRLPADALITAAARRFGASVEDVKGPSRRSCLMGPRVVVSRILKERGHSFPMIGRLLNRDHTTIIHRVQNFDIFERRDPRITTVYEELRDQ